MKRRHLLLVALSLIIAVCMCLGLAGCGKKKAVALSVPVVTVSESGVASWDEIENASGYAYKIDDGEEKATNNTSVTLADGQSIVVKAVGDGKRYSDSEWSTSQTYTKPAAQTLSAPVVSISDSGLASWTAVPNASGYKYKINNGEEQTANGTSVQLENGQSIVVKAVGNGTTYLDSNWSESKTYTATVTQPTKLDKPVVTVNESGLATWAAVSNADAYAVKVNGGTPVETEATQYQLANGDKIQVKAISDSADYTESDWSDEVTYTKTEPQPPVNPVKLDKPVVTISEAGVASWVADTNASSYKYKIGENGEEKVAEGNSVTLTDGQSIYVKAIGDGTNYTDSDWSDKATYTAPVVAVKLDPPTVSIARDGTVTISCENASGYKYKIGGGNVQDLAGTVKLTDGQSISVMAVGDGTNYTDSDWTNAITYRAPGKFAAVAVENVEFSAADSQDGKEQVAIAWTHEDGQSFVLELTDSTGTNNLKVNEGSAVIELKNYTRIRIKVAETNGTPATAGNYSAFKDESDYTDLTALFNTFVDGRAAEQAKNALSLPNPTKQPSTYTYKLSLTSGSATVTWAVSGLEESEYTLEGNTLVINRRLGADVTVTITATLTVGSVAVAKEFPVVIEARELTPLVKPVVNVSESGLASWKAVANAKGYIVELNGTALEAQTELSYQLSNGDKIKVKAVGDHEYYADSDWSAEKIYKVLSEDASDEEKVDSVIANLEIAAPEIGVDDYTYTLPLSDNYDTTIEWSFMGLNEDNYVYDDEEGTLVITRVWEDVRFVATAKVSLGEVSKSKQIPLTVEKHDPVKLATPAVVLGEDNIARWEAVLHADKYILTISSLTGIVTEETTELEKALTEGQSLQVQAVSNEAEKYPDSELSDPVTVYIPLATPVVRIEGLVAKWDDDTNAGGYYVKVNGELVEGIIADAYYTLKEGDTIQVQAVIKENDKFHKNSDWSAVKNVPYTLGTPEVHIDRETNEASWVAVPHATSYIVKRGGAESEQVGTSIILNDGETIQVKAISDNKNYVESGWSTSVTAYITLGTPVVTVVDCVASWTAIDGAAAYLVKVNGNSTPVKITDTQYTLNKGDTIQVQAIYGEDDTTHRNSAWSDLVIVYYTLDTPEVDLNKETNVASWEAVDNAEGYIVEIDGVEQPQQTGTSIQLEEGVTIRVKAVSSDELYLDSEWSDYVTTLITLTKPVVTVNADTGVASWNIDSRADHYVYKINGGEEQTATGNTVNLTPGNKIVVKAVGDGETYKDSVWSDEESYIPVNEIVTLDFAEATHSARVGNYTSSFTATSNEFSWTVSNFNNNSTATPWGYVKTGRNGNAVVGTIATDSAIVDYITKVIVTVDNLAQANKINSFRLEVSSNGEFTKDDIVETVTVTIVKGTNEFLLTNFVSGHYYRIVVDCASGTSNGFVQISKVEYLGYLDETVHRHHWASYTHNDGAWTHTAHCDVEGCDYENGNKTADCIPEYNVCPVCEYEYKANEILDALFALTSNGSLTGTYSLTGVVTSIYTAYNSSDKTITFYFIVAGRELEAYKAKSGSTETDYASLVQVGYTVTVQGILKKYNSTYEFDTNCLITSVDSEDHRSDEEKVLAEKNLFKFADTQYSAIENNIQLPNESGEASLTWKVKNEDDNEWVTIDELNLMSILQLPAGEPYDVTLTVVFKIGDATAEKDIVITLYPSDAKGTPSNPYSVTEALEVIKELPSDGYTDAPVYVTGYVIDCGSWNSTYGNFTNVYIADSASSINTSADALQVYRLYPDGEVVKGQADLKLGAKIVAVGYLQNYKGNTPEMTFKDTNNPEIVSYEDPTDEAKVAIALKAVRNLSDVTKAENVTLPVSSVAGVSFSWESDNSTYTISEDGAKLVVSTLPEEDVTVTLTVTATCGTVTAESGNNTKTITVVIKAPSDEPVGDSWTKVESASDLQAGDIIVIAFKDESVAMGAIAGTGNSYYNQVSITFGDDPDFGTFNFAENTDGYGLSSNKVVAIQLESSGDSGYPFNLKVLNTGKYINTISSGNNVKEDANTADNSKWSISVDSNGNATITAKAGGSTLFQYNKSNTRFSAYKSSSNMKNPQIYKKSGGSTGGGTTDPSTPTKLDTPTVTINASGLASWPAVTGATGYVVKIGATETNQTELNKQLSNGQSIQVKAVGDGTNYTDSEFSTAQTYTESTGGGDTGGEDKIVTLAELDFSQKSTFELKGTLTDYYQGGTFTATVSEQVWSFTNFNGSNTASTWDCVKAGQKSNAAVATVSTEISGKVTSFEFDVKASKDVSSLINSVTLTVNGEAISITDAITTTKTTITVNIPANKQGEGYTYTLTLDMLSMSGTNGAIEIYRLAFNGYAA